MKFSSINRPLGVFMNFTPFLVGSSWERWGAGYDTEDETVFFKEKFFCLGHNIG